MVSRRADKLSAAAVRRSTKVGGGGAHKLSAAAARRGAAGARLYPGQKPPRTIEIEFVQRTFVQDFCTRPTKNRGVQDVGRTFWEGPGMCDKV